MSAQVVQFTDVVRDVSGGNSKLPQSAFQKSGSLAVVDQGQGFVAGYTDDLTYRFRSESLPVIVFGDHTKAIKYIDFPFAMGADGVKVLKPTSECDTKYLYHYLRYARIPDAGYSRHYKFLKELRVPLPSLPEQHRIAAILDKAEALRAKRREAIAKLDQLLQSVFLDMFGDPVTNPKGWPVTSIGENCEKVTVGIVVKPASYYVESGVPAIRSLNIGVNRIIAEDFVYFSEADNVGPLKKTMLRTGDVVAVRSGQPGKAAVVPASLDGANAIDVLIARTNNKLMLPEFLAHFMNSSGGKRLVLSEQRGQVQKHLNVKQLSEAEIPLPPIAVQRKFLQLAHSIEALREKMRASLDKAGASLASMQCRGFIGAL
ncbi:restriction endonuclease subunit S [Lysobacter firmicutimachus]|uniref:Restriction endonuclease subunit S n=1 Tax=Lysobacter firmicutimachus TaxID=1792846 RepID=A0ABU8D6Y5_9GAMM